MLSISKEGALIYKHDGETLQIEAWGENAVRVRSTLLYEFPKEDWALTNKPKLSRESMLAPADLSEGPAHLTNGKISVTISPVGKMTIKNTKTNAILLEEFVRHRRDATDPNVSALELEARQFRSIPGSDHFHIVARFESQSRKEQIYGMGQYQQDNLNLKGSDVELAQRNSQASIPFATSSLGYGLLWNNPSIGRAVFGQNVMSFESLSAKALDYWVVAGDTPAEIQEAYASVTGTVPMMPEYGLGFWQCKLRYQTQEELLNVVRKHKKLGLPMDVIVCDFFHWPKQGDWKFDPTYWPDPEAMIAELKEHKVELMVSIWPTLDKGSDNYDAFRDANLLVRSERGSQIQQEFEGECRYADFTSPETQRAVWSIAKRNYHDKGIKTFWLDEAEPEFCRYDLDNYRMYAGSGLSVGNSYPVGYSKAFYDGQLASGQPEGSIINLVRCAWAGSQKYGALVWSGDIASSWSSFRNQLAAGLNMGLSGIPWWTTDIGGFHGGDPREPAFRELMVRWFQWGTFCPVMRLHGNREPVQPQHGTTGGATCRSGADNEVWSYGEEVFKICKKYLFLREYLRPYTRELMQKAHKDGTPVMRTMFYVFPQDAYCWSMECEQQYMYGDKYLVAPVLEAGQAETKVYLPKGHQWKKVDASNVESQGQITHDSEVCQGGQTISVASPMEDMPVFERV
ncbi:glycoside hydrolase family 31 protein [Meira miltonrushii]|uniref:Glycoside hydrolase family 31 protein n=1 Tax=Meira miltonrushii TaxID=1280837 RepID=A0A316VMC5_9BASI|nr:glycoside hydrolase family 31 protein [Meira miltonrushii]PWN38460.1 glycoside hydrolase family 31 protein [Meira miltonrushii]